LGVAAKREDEAQRALELPHPQHPGQITCASNFKVPVRIGFAAGLSGRGRQWQRRAGALRTTEIRHVRTRVLLRGVIGFVSRRLRRLIGRSNIQQRKVVMTSNNDGLLDRHRNDR
jgi:hypothetical protein